MVKGIREGDNPEDIVNLPQNTILRLNTLHVQGRTLSSPEVLGELCDHYKYFLWCYHLSQENYRRNSNHELEIEFDRVETKKRAESLEKILNSYRLRV